MLISQRQTIHTGIQSDHMHKVCLLPAQIFQTVNTDEINQIAWKLQSLFLGMQSVFIIFSFFIVVQVQLSPFPPTPGPSPPPKEVTIS